MEAIGLGVFAPSDELIPSRLSRVVENARRLEGLGFTVHLGETIDTAAGGSPATSPKGRAKEIMSLARRPDVHVLIGAWGGKTCNELLELLDFEELATTGKPLIGFSDVAVLSNAIYLVAGAKALFGPNVLGKLHESRFGDLAIIKSGYACGEDPFLTYRAKYSYFSGDRVVEGTLLGGNLGTFALSIASWQKVKISHPAIFFFETTQTDPRIVRQYLAALKLAGVFDAATGVIIGDIPFAATFDEACRFADHVRASCNAPTAYVPTFGHGMFLNPPIPIGLQCHLDPIAGQISVTNSWRPLPLRESVADRGRTTKRG